MEEPASASSFPFSELCLRALGQMVSGSLRAKKKPQTQTKMKPKPKENPQNLQRGDSLENWKLRSKTANGSISLFLQRALGKRLSCELSF